MTRAVATICVLLAALVTTSRGSAQQVVYAASVPTELDSVTRAALTRELGLAKLRGLPVEPLVAKVREGQIKRADPARIRTAVAALAQRLDSARTALGSASNAAELVAGADALSAGADAVSLRAVRAASGARDVAAPLGALAQLVATGVPVRRAAQMIVELLHHDPLPGHILAFGNAVEADVGAGVPAEESALFRLRAIEAAISGDRVTAATATPGGFTQDGSRPKRKP
jgi:hypothetical protein